MTTNRRFMWASILMYSRARKIRRSRAAKVTLTMASVQPPRALVGKQCRKQPQTCVVCRRPENRLTGLFPTRRDTALEYRATWKSEIALLKQLAERRKRKQPVWVMRECRVAVVELPQQQHQPYDEKADVRRADNQFRLVQCFMASRRRSKKISGTFRCSITSRSNT